MEKCTAILKPDACDNLRVGLLNRRLKNSSSHIWCPLCKEITSRQSPWEFESQDGIMPGVLFYWSYKSEIYIYIYSYHNETVYTSTRGRDVK